MANELDKVEKMTGMATATFAGVPQPVHNPPPPTSYRRLVYNAVISTPPAKIEARPALGPLVEEANRLLSDPNTTNEAFLDVYGRMMRVGPST